MSWLQKIQNELIIRTGDGREYKPNWLNPKLEVEYNTSQFEFPDIAGTLVHRTTNKGYKYSLELYFQGEDHLDVSEAFRNSANDPRAWTLTHPFFGRILGQPTGLLFDNTGYNVSKITGTFIETITEDSPRTSVDPKTKVAGGKSDTDEVFAAGFAAYATQTPPSTTDILTMQENNISLYNYGKKKVKLTEDAEAYFNLFNEANTAILDATTEPLAAMRALQAVINYPYLFQDSVQNRVTILVDQFEILRNGIGNIIGPSEKRIYENNSASLISSMAAASSSPQDGNYQNRDDVYAIIEIILAQYNAYVEDLDSLQTDNGGELDSYIPDAESLIALNELINYTLANLFDIALNSRQERTIILEDDSNAVLLTHRFYGLDDADSNLNIFINTNNIGINEILGIKKGRTLRYYV